MAPVRTPVPDTLDKPACYGLLYRVDRPLCRDCPVRPSCRDLCGVWNRTLSLAELCRRASVEVRPVGLDKATLEEIYDREFERHFGRRSPRRRSKRNDAIFARLRPFLERDGIDPATFVSANMQVLGKAARGLRCGFQPTMLCGEKAKARYNGFLRRANRRYRRGLGDVAESTSDLGKLRYTLFLDEREVGEMFCRLLWARSAWSWERAVEHCAPSSVWLAFERRRGREYNHWRRALGVEGIKREKQLSRLRAACAVAEGFEIGLSERIAVHEFSWGALATLLTRLFSPPDRATLDLGGVPGLLWGA